MNKYKGFFSSSVDDDLSSDDDDLYLEDDDLYVDEEEDPDLYADEDEDEAPPARGPVSKKTSGQKSKQSKGRPSRKKNDGTPPSAKKSRLAVNILRTILVVLVYAAAAIAAIFPVSQVRQNRDADSFSFSMVDVFTGQAQLASFTDRYTEVFLLNGGLELLTQEQKENTHSGAITGTFYGTHLSSPDTLVMEDIAFKRGEVRGFNGYQRMYGIETYFALIQKNYDLFASGNLDNTKAEILVQKLTRARTAAQEIYNLFPYEIEHMNYGGVLHFLQKIYAAEKNGEFNRRTVDFLSRDYFLTTYDADVLYSELSEKLDGLRDVVKDNMLLLPDAHDIFEIEKDTVTGSPTVDISSEIGVGSTDCFLFSIFYLALIVITLILNLVSTVTLILQWVDKMSKIRTSHKGPWFLFLAIMSVGGLGLSTSAVRTEISMVSGLVIVLFLFIFVYEIICNVFVKHYRKNYMPKKK